MLRTRVHAQYMGSAIIPDPTSWLDGYLQITAHTGLHKTLAKNS